MTGAHRRLTAAKNFPWPGFGFVIPAQTEPIRANPNKRQPAQKFADAYLRLGGGIAPELHLLHQPAGKIFQFLSPNFT